MSKSGTLLRFQVTIGDRPVTMSYQETEGLLLDIDITNSHHDQETVTHIKKIFQEAQINCEGNCKEQMDHARKLYRFQFNVNEVKPVLDALNNAGIFAMPDACKAPSRLTSYGQSERIHWYENMMIKNSILSAISKHKISQTYSSTQSKISVTEKLPRTELKISKTHRRIRNTLNFRDVLKNFYSIFHAKHESLKSVSKSAVPAKIRRLPS